MCGIAGLQTMDGSPPAVAILDSLTRAMAHRGPDGSGRLLVGGSGAIQTRLAIVDLVTGDQPIFGPNGTALVANGEIYNDLDIRQRYRDETFTTRSDCEAPLAVYRSNRADYPNQLRGMYAIALSDAQEQAFHLSRDPFGIKPLYYAETSRGFVFASELQAILKTGLVRPVARPEAAAELLQLQFTTGRETIIGGINRVLPGETISVKNGRIAETKTIAALPAIAPRETNEAEALRDLDRVLMNSVLVHQRADVPYGMFLSGGIDSSALLVCMSRLNERPVRAFTAGFPGTDVHDEREQARKVAEACGAEHIEISVTEKDFWNSLPTIVAAVDDPVADYAIIPTFLLGREAAKGVKVVLSGEGGDEIFAGYGRYRSAMRPRILGGRAMRRHGALDGLGVLRVADRNWRQGIAAAETAASKHEGFTKLQKAQHVDCADWLPNDLLIKLDRCLMAHGLEGRTPFLDPVVADFGFCLPDRLKIFSGCGKYLVRRWLDEALPIAEPFAPKRGFTVPVGHWIQTRAEELAPLVARNEGVNAICHHEAVLKLFQGFSRTGGAREGVACWHLLFYALWHRVHAQRVLPEGNVLDVLEVA